MGATFAPIAALLLSAAVLLMGNGLHPLVEPTGIRGSNAAKPPLPLSTDGANAGILLPAVVGNVNVVLQSVTKALGHAHCCLPAE